MYRFATMIAILAFVTFPLAAQPAQQPGAPGSPEQPGLPGQPEVVQPGIPGQEPASDQEQFGELPPNLHRVSELSDLSISDDRGAEIGSVEDVVITPDGRISHLIAGLDGFRDLEPGRYLVSADRLAPERNRITLRETQQSVRIENDDQIRRQIGQGAILASRLMEFDVMGSNGDSIGSIEDIVVDLQEGSVAYVALGSGGFLGLGEDLFAVPFDELQIDANRDTVSVDATEDQLEQAGGFSRANWPESTDENWAEPRMGEVGREAEKEGSILGSEESDQMGQGPRIPGMPEPPEQPPEPVEPVPPQQPQVFPAR